MTDIQFQQLTNSIDELSKKISDIKLPEKSRSDDLQKLADAMSKAQAEMKVAQKSKANAFTKAQYGWTLPMLLKLHVLRCPRMDFQ